MVKTRELSKIEREERRNVRGLAEIAEEIVPEETEIHFNKESFYVKFEGGIEGEIRRREGLGHEVIYVSSPEILKYAIRIAEEYEDYIGERVTIEKGYGN
jgi:hypothetical protein